MNLSSCIFFFGRNHRKHKLVDIRTTYQTKRQQHKKVIHFIRNETLNNECVLLRKLKSNLNTDVQTLRSKVSRCQSQMRIKGQELKNLMDGTIGNLITNARDAYISLLQSIRKDQALIIARIQNYEYRHEQSAYRPVQFCRFIKTVHFPQIQEKNRTQHCLLSVTQEINMEDLIKIMDGDIHLLERWIGNVLLLTPMSSPVVLKSLSVTDVWWCVHISCVTPNRVWVSDWNNVSLIDTSTGKTIYRLNNSAVLESGIHTVNYS